MHFATKLKFILSKLQLGNGANANAGLKMPATCAQLKDLQVFKSNLNVYLVTWRSLLLLISFCATAWAIQNDKVFSHFVASHCFFIWLQVWNILLLSKGLSILRIRWYLSTLQPQPVSPYQDVVRLRQMSNIFLCKFLLIL